ncbi:hypothetical protein [Actinomadura nitritigenes]|uniref:hypothetical protein n=1 Tax=Actinomadura nitritigenes TaxID=134602 RepID=UPI003D8D2B07
MIHSDHGAQFTSWVFTQRAKVSGLVASMSSISHCFDNAVIDRPHQGITNVRPLKQMPSPITEPDQIAHLSIRRRQRLGGILSEYEHAAWPART